MGISEPRPAAPRLYDSPTPITEDHRLDSFDCGKEPLNAWLRDHALGNEGKASRTYIVVARTGDEVETIAAYYTLAYGSVTLKDVPRKYRQGMPNPVPVMVLGRLAVDHRHGNRALGSAMLREAFQRTLQASEVAGLRALVIHALDDEAVGFYVKYGFQLFPAGSRTMFLPVETIHASMV